MFLCREAELGRLHDLYSSNSFEAAVIYGRRRVGKTALINEFVKDKNTIYFPALNANVQANLAAFSGSIQNLTDPGASEVPVYQSFRSAFDAVTRIASRDKTILVIDEFQYLARSDSSLVREIARFIKGDWSGTDMLLILCGSSASFMESEVLGEHSPLSELITAEIRLEPFDYLETARFNPDLSPADNALIYAITGGIPHYINKLGVRGDLREAVLSNLLEASSSLFEEPENQLRSELREPALYNSIITAIARGHSKLGDIAGTTGMETSACSKYITTLTDLGIVRKVEPAVGRSRRKTQYRLTDNLFRFWYRFVPSNMISISSGNTERVYDRAVQELPDYMKLPFEEICRQYLARHAEHVPFRAGELGEWWGSLSQGGAGRRMKKGADTHIDIVGVSQASGGSRFIIGSCKYEDDPADEDDLDRLRSSVSEFTSANDECYYYIFSKNGFTSELIEHQTRGEVSLVSLEDMYRNISN